jgi:hypothetical protein
MLAASIDHSVAMYSIQLFLQGVLKYCELNFHHQIARHSKCSLALCNI